jgi:hypothetical protein
MPNNVGPDARFAIIEIPPGPAPPNAIMWGNKDAVMRCIPQSVANVEQEQRLRDEAAVIAKQQDEARANTGKMAQIFADRVEHLSGRLDAFEPRKAERADQLQREAEEAEVEAIEEMLSGLPDPDQATFGDDGELEIVQPVDPAKHDPEGEARSEAATGAMPKELDKGAPPLSGDYSLNVTPPSKYRDPTSIGGP